VSLAAATSSVLARALVDRRFSRALLDGRLPPLAPAERAVAGAVDAERLALFAGFITKVRHSDLFEHLPGTLALLRQHGVEIAVFRDYFLTCDPQPRGDTDAKVAAALAHFARFAATRRGRAVVGLGDVVAHERCRWELRRAAAQHRASPAIPRAAGDAVLAGPVQVLRLRRDPEAVIVAARRGARLRVQPGVRWWLYWVDVAAGELREVEIDRDVAAVVHAIAAGTSAARVSARRRRAIVAELAAVGVIRVAGSAR
jgi:hypothetical protein